MAKRVWAGLADMVFEARGKNSEGSQGGGGFVGEGVWVGRRSRYIESMHLESGQRLFLCSGFVREMG